MAPRIDYRPGSHAAGSTLSQLPLGPVQGRDGLGVGDAPVKHRLPRLGQAQ